uniref:C2H2-type domain-containing protein n=1 Tax=Leptobrachium leishanense TaxID=445787 RepID=A0A8C5Q0D8_9ANUR
MAKSPQPRDVMAKSPQPRDVMAKSPQPRDVMAKSPQPRDVMTENRYPRDVMTESHQSLYSLDAAFGGNVIKEPDTQIPSLNFIKETQHDILTYQTASCSAKRDPPTTETSVEHGEEELGGLTCTTEYPSAHSEEESALFPDKNVAETYRPKRYSNTLIKEEPASFEDTLRRPDRYTLTAYPETDYTSTFIIKEEELSSCEEGDSMEADNYTHLLCPQTGYTSTPTQDPASYNENVLDVYASSEYSQLKYQPEGETTSYDGMNYTDMYTPTENTQTRVRYCNNLGDLGTSNAHPSGSFMRIKPVDNNYDYMSHQNTHTPELLYQCAECQKGFTNNAELVKHQSSHKEKKLACSVCGKAFLWKSSLDKHFMIHTGHKPFKCLECGKSFIDKWKLDRHKRSHTNEKPYACSECGKYFTQKSNLFVHQRIHKNEKPFSCPICGRCFTDRSNLYTHQRVHTSEKPFPCPVCGKCFAQKSAIRKHLLIHQRAEVVPSI